MENDRKKKYENKRVIKRVSFNSELEKDLLDFAKSIDFSVWVKNKIIEELKKPRN
ncbi:hypothetical protein [Acinetobacter soli]|uniref:hypothetical protein n=1 Tax=Acinetobacter soli TaxID=487316 RepID=UPI002FF288E3